MKNNLRLSFALAFAIVLTIASSGYASTFKVIYTFGASGTSDAALPEGDLIMDAAGNLYGTTLGGGTGAYSAGTVFELSPNSDGSWTEKVLYSFTGMADGATPIGGVVFDSQGNLYGTTQNGGSFIGPACSGSGGCGVVFELSPSATGWTETVLHTFSGQPDGAFPMAPVVLDADGNAYGTTAGGGVDNLCYLGCGTVFELEKAKGWKETILHTFRNGGNDGQVRWAGWHLTVTET